MGFRVVGSAGVSSAIQAVPADELGSEVLTAQRHPKKNHDQLCMALQSKGSGRFAGTQLHPPALASGAIHRWIFEKRGKSMEVDVKGSLIVSDDLAIPAAAHRL
jgi:hypothetical protein